MSRFTHYKIELDRSLGFYVDLYSKKSADSGKYQSAVDGLIGEFCRAFGTESFFSDYHDSMLIPIVEEGSKEIAAFELKDTASSLSFRISREILDETTYRELCSFIGKGKNLREVERKLKARYREDATLKPSLVDFCMGFRELYILKFIKPVPERAKLISSYLSMDAFSFDASIVNGQHDGELFIQPPPLNNRLFSFRKMPDGSYQNVESLNLKLVILPDKKELASVLVRATYHINADGSLRKAPTLLVSIEEKFNPAIHATLVHFKKSTQVADFIKNQVFSSENNSVLAKGAIVIRSLGFASAKDLSAQRKNELSAGLNFPVLQEKFSFLHWIYEHRLILSISLFILLVTIAIAVISGASPLIPALPFFSPESIFGLSLSAEALSAAAESLLGFVLFLGGIAISACIPNEPKVNPQAVIVATKNEKELPPRVPSVSDRVTGEAIAPALIAALAATPQAEVGHGPEFDVLAKEGLETVSFHQKPL